MFQQKNGINPLLIITRSQTDISYLEYQFDLYKEFCKQGITYHQKIIKGYDRIYELCRFRTRSLPVFKSYREKWYPKGKKIIPRDLKLSPLILSIWFCNDGCISFKTNRSGLKDQALIVKFATHGFSEDDVGFLSSLLEKETKESFHVYKEKKNFYIKGFTQSAKAIINLVDPVLPVSMNRKYVWRI